MLLMGQQTDYTIDISRLKHTLFIAHETTFELTREIRPNGIVLFHRGFLNSDSLERDKNRLFHIERGRIISRTDRHLEAGTDTLHTLFADRSYPLPTLVSYKDVFAVEDVLLDHAECAFVLRDFGITAFHSNAVYHLFANDLRSTQDPAEYMLYEIDDWESATPKFSCYWGQYDSSGQFRVQCTTEPKLRIRGKNMLRRRLYEIKAKQVTRCLVPRNLEDMDLFYIDGREFLFSRACVWNTSKGKNYVIIPGLLPSHIGNCCR